MSLRRLIARLDIKGPNVVKGIRFEGLRVVGKPADMARRYAESGADELLYIDTVATLYGRNQLEALIEETCEDVFVPITVGGGVTDLEQFRSLLRVGADKISVNTAAIKTPKIISSCADICGKQAVVVSIEAKRTPHGWEAYTDNGREKTGKDAIKWAREAVALGAGEILLTSIDQEGTRNGCDLALVQSLRDLPVPLTYCGGIGSIGDAAAALGAGATAVACASALHYGAFTIGEMKHELDQVEFPHLWRSEKRRACA